MREVNSKLDPASRQQMFEIVVREAIEDLEETRAKWVVELGNLSDLEKRVKVLEEARAVQRQLNVKFENGLAPQARKEPTKVPVKEVKSFWPWRR